MTNIAIYARFSSDLQRDASIEDQIRECQARADKEGWNVVQCYTDHAISGASMNRPGIQALLRDAADGKIEVVLAEALDRLSRDQGDTAHLHKRLKFLGIQIVTLSEGDVGTVDVGVKGLMNQLYLEEMKAKVLRGQKGRVEAGKVTAGLAYGYAVVKKFGADGKPVAGEREIVPEQAEIVQRIFREYAHGKSPRAIAIDLNKEGVQSPTGRGWHQSSIHSSQKRGLGIINNDVYRGKLCWNRTTELKEPGTNRRIPRINDESQLVMADVEHLRIISDELWDAVKARQAKMARGSRKLGETKRPKYLLSGLLKCGACGGSYSKANHGRYGCANRRNAKSCDNTLMIHQDELEGVVIGSLRSRLLTPELLDVFCREYTKQINKLRRTKSAEADWLRAEIAKLERARKRHIEAIEGGIDPKEIKDTMNGNGDRRRELEQRLLMTDETPVRLHPKMADHYKRQIDRLVEALNDESIKHEAQDILRNLIDKIVLEPNTAKNGLVIDLHGDLAGILSIAETKPERRKPMKTGTDIRSVLQVVGPEGLEPPT